jgi:ATP-dependent protease ClpP protease subunit
MRDHLAKIQATLAQVPRAGVQALLPPAPDNRGWRLEAATEQAATVWIYDAIGAGGVDAGQLVPELDAIKAEQITVRLNSPGGDYFAGVAIANALARHPATVSVQVDGLAASAASVVAMAGDEVVMHPGSQMMIHDALTLTIGNAADHEKTRALLDSASEDIAKLYASRAGGDPSTWRASMQAETWYTSEQAVSAGLATSAPVPEGNTGGNRWTDTLAAFHTAKTPGSAALPTPEPEATPDPSSPGPVNLSELFSSAFRKATK